MKHQKRYLTSSTSGKNAHNMKSNHDIKINIHGLHPLSKDDRDFSLAGFFDQIKIEDIPKIDFCVEGEKIIKNQGNTDYCSAYAVTGASAYQEGIDLCPEYQFFKTKMLMGNPDVWGADLRAACKSAVKYGSLPVSSLGRTSLDLTSRYNVVDQKTWPKFLDMDAYIHRKETYFQVDGRYDTFDNIRTALWQNIKDKRAIIVGASWRQEWTDAPGGIISEIYQSEGFGHAFIIIGQKIIYNTPYLIAQLSNGTNIGDDGLFYFPRAVVNKELSPYGQFMFQDVARETVDGQSNTLTTSWYSKIMNAFINLFHK